MKSLEYAYPTSKNANDYGCAKTGCWMVATKTKDHTPVGRKAFDSKKAAQAAFNAALVAQLAAPANADAGYWRDVAAKFRKAAAAMADLHDRRDAELRASEAEQVAQDIESRPAR